MKLKDLAALVSGRLSGSGEIEIRGVANIDQAGEGDLAFLLDAGFLSSLQISKAAAVVSSPKNRISGKPVIYADNPRLAMAKILAVFAPKNQPAYSIHPSAVVARSAGIAGNVIIHPFVYIGENCEIGEGSILHPSVTLYDNVKIGKRVIIHSGARIGIDGFGFAQEGKKHVKIPQIGSVIIEDDVEIFANVCIARAMLGATRIGRGTKIDNLTHIAHNCRIGENCAIVSLVGFAGSVTLGDNVLVSGQVGFNGHIKVGSNSIVLAKAGVTKDIPPNSVVSGFPAQDHSEELRYQAALKRLAKRKK